MKTLATAILALASLLLSGPSSLAQSTSLGARTDFKTQHVKLIIPPASNSRSITAPDGFEQVARENTIALISSITQHAFGFPFNVAEAGYYKEGEGPELGHLAPPWTRPDMISARVTLDDDATLTAKRHLHAASPTEVWVLLIEYVGPPGGPNEFLVRDRTVNYWTYDRKLESYGPIASVGDPNRVVVFSGGTENTNHWASMFDRGDVSASLDESKMVRLARGDGNGAVKSSHQVVEFTGGNWTLQKGSVAPTHPATEVRIEDVGDVSTAWVYFTFSTDSSNTDERGHRLWLSSPTQLKVEEEPDATGSKVVQWHVISNPLLHVQTGTADNAFASDLTQAIRGFAPVKHMTRSFAWVTGPTNSGDNRHPSGMWGFELEDPSTIRLVRHRSGFGLHYRYQVVELP